MLRDSLLVPNRLSANSRTASRREAGKGAKTEPLQLADCEGRSTYIKRGPTRKHLTYIVHIHLLHRIRTEWHSSATDRQRRREKSPVPHHLHGNTRGCLFCCASSLVCPRLWMFGGRNGGVIGEMGQLLYVVLRPVRHRCILFPCRRIIS